MEFSPPTERATASPWSLRHAMINPRFSVPRCGVLVAGVVVAACLVSGTQREVNAQQRASTVRAPIWNPDHTFRLYPKSWLELRNQNVVMQKRDYSCGAAALATLIRYHWGDSATEGQLIREVVRMLTPKEMKERIKNGLSLTDLRRLAVRIGYLATIGRLDFEKLRKSKVPLIVGIVVNDFDHFVVYRGTDGHYV